MRGKTIASVRRLGGCLLAVCKSRRSILGNNGLPHHREKTGTGAGSSLQPGCTTQVTRPLPLLLGLLGLHGPACRLQEGRAVPRRLLQAAHRHLLLIGSGANAPNNLRLQTSRPGGPDGFVACGSRGTHPADWDCSARRLAANQWSWWYVTRARGTSCCIGNGGLGCGSDADATTTSGRAVQLQVRHGRPTESAVFRCHGSRSLRILARVHEAPAVRGGARLGLRRQDHCSISILARPDGLSRALSLSST